MTQFLILHVYRNLNLKQCLILNTLLNRLSVPFLHHWKEFLKSYFLIKLKTLRFAEMQEFEVMIFLGVISVYFMLVCVIWCTPGHSSCVAFHCNGRVGFVVLSLFLFIKLHPQLSNLNQKCKVMLQIYRPYKPG